VASLARDVLYLGLGTTFPIALEGALKLKEISYIHTEGYAAGEMKHGPIALIDENVPVVMVAPPDAVFEKTLSNVEEVIARGGKVVMISDAAGVARLDGAPSASPCRNASFVAPLLYVVSVQLLAYQVAVLKAPMSTSRATSPRASPWSSEPSAIDPGMAALRRRKRHRGS
jgi:glucosamine--fructose-6-phosphate aminotransferase (isomerizing)